MSGDAPRGRASVLTPAGRGAVAVVAAEGRTALTAVDAAFQAANGRRIANQPVDRIVFGEWVSGDHREEVVVVRGAGESLEIHCHGGVAAAGRITAALAAAGCEIEPWPQWRAREGDDLLAVEADVALAAATTQRAAAILLDQRQGALRREVAAAQRELNAGELVAARTRLTALLARAPLGLHLTRPWLVSIAGRPNVGKSSLINALVGYQRAIVFDRPGTTRDVLTAETAIDGWPVRLTDAAGIREAVDSLEAEGVARARRQLQEADLVLWVLDATTLADDPNKVAEREWPSELGSSVEMSNALLVVNKCDLVAADGADFDCADAIYTSATTGAGLDHLLSAIGRRLVPSPPSPSEAMPFTTRQIELLERSMQQIDLGAALALLDRLRGCAYGFRRLIL